MTSSSDRRAYVGPALFSYGFRPFFLAAGIFAVAAITLWTFVFHGRLELATAFGPRDWHVHEMIFGYIPAVLTGFLFTAIPNWTGRLPIRGQPLVLLLLLWLAGRLAVLTSADIGWIPAMIIDGAFLVSVALAAGREVLAGKNWRNMRIVTLIIALALANFAFHVEARLTGEADVSTRGGIAVIIMMISVIGGRIIPSFTHTWLSRRPIGGVQAHPVGRLPASLGTFDVVTLAASLAGLGLWAALPVSRLTGAVLIVLALLHAIRLARWAGERTFREPLLLVLHVAYAFIPLGFILTGLSAFDLLASSAGIHAWTIGAFGSMTLAVMTRASLAHTGRAVIASWPIRVAYVLIVVAAVVRICAAVQPTASSASLDTAAAGWIAEFALFTVSFWPVLVHRKE